MLVYGLLSLLDIVVQATSPTHLQLCNNAMPYSNVTNRQVKLLTIDLALAGGGASSSQSSAGRQKVLHNWLRDHKSVWKP